MACSLLGRTVPSSAGLSASPSATSSVFPAEALLHGVRHSLRQNLFQVHTVGTIRSVSFHRHVRFASHNCIGTCARHCGFSMTSIKVPTVPLLPILELLRSTLFSAFFFYDGKNSTCCAPPQGGHVPSVLASLAKHWYRMNLMISLLVQGPWNVVVGMGSKRVVLIIVWSIGILPSAIMLFLWFGDVGFSRCELILAMLLAVFP